jgi:hypothetical protein
MHWEKDKKKAEGAMTSGSGKQMTGDEDNILLVHSKKFRFEQNISSQ